MKKKIIITGGLGYIGTELCRLYSGVSWHHKILVIDNRFISERVNQIRNWNMEFIHGDILDKDLVNKYFSNADVVHHLAGITSVPRTKSESSKEIDEKIKLVAEEGTQNILNTISNECKLIFPSTHVVYEGISEVKNDIKGYQVFLSRTHPQFLSKLFFQEVPEIYEGTIEIKSVARDPGSRAKIAVFTKEKSIDPVGACVGMRGSRVQAVVNELQGEKIDIVLWSEDIATFIVNALGPAEVEKVVIEEDLKKIDVIVPDEQLSLAIGRKGQNVRLASSLSGWSIDILTTSQESEKRSEEFKETINYILKRTK